jgi:anti-anti-sigma regulatory factor
VNDRLSYLRGDHDAMVLEGAIDERANLDKLVEFARDGALVLDLEGVTYINSLGVRAWCHLIQLTRKLGLRVELRRVSERMVHQLNIVPAARAMVSSFFALYVCDHCGHEQQSLLDVQRDALDLARGKAPAKNCNECGSPAEFGEHPDLYFAFLVG